MLELIKKITRAKYFKLVLFSFIGFLGGYLYYYFIGCNGTCPITSKWYTSSLYGMLIGAIAGFPTTERKSEKQNE